MKKKKILKVSMLMFLSFVLITSCKKDKTIDPQTENTVELEFQIEQTDFGGFKSTNSDVPMCIDLTMDYVVFDFNGTEYTSPLFTTMAIVMPACS